MIVIAIIGILAAVAIPSYNGYIQTTKTAKVIEHASIASRYITAGFTKDLSESALNTAKTFPQSETALLVELNSNGKAPENNAAPYLVAAASDSLGQVGISVIQTTGGVWTLNDTAQIITPAYGGLTSSTETVSYN